MATCSLLWIMATTFRLHVCGTYCGMYVAACAHTVHMCCICVATCNENLTRFVTDSSSKIPGRISRPPAAPAQEREVRANLYKAGDLGIAECESTKDSDTESTHSSLVARVQRVHCALQRNRL